MPKIYHHLDKPHRIFIWTMDEALICIVPLIFFPKIGFFTSILLSLIGIVSYRTIKKRFGKGLFREFLQYHMGLFDMRNKKLPKFHKRNFYK